jgi:general secretion pathway protein A
MYESHFGLSGSPFQLNPDPAFFYDSRGHRHALAYLKYGAHQGEGFIIVTGEIGAGKTTVVRALLEGLDRTKVVAAQIVSTQLASGDLLRAILIAFGVPVQSESKAHLISTLEAFMTSLAAQGRRALLIIDEAQNLGREAIEELRMLSNFQLGNHSLLQSFLVGQPELRTLLKSKAMEQLRQRITASCHLTPLDVVDTRKYIEHRLKHVDWSGNPAFTIAAYERIHVWTGGVPRRINRLCNRLLLAAYLQNSTQISEALVIETANELRAEIGEVGDATTPEPASPAPVAVSEVQDSAAAEAHAAEKAELEAAAAPSTAPVKAARAALHASQRAAARPRRMPGVAAGSLMCLCDSPSGYWKLVALGQALAEFSDIPAMTIVHTGTERHTGTMAGTLASGCTVSHLGLEGGDYARMTSTAIPRFDAVLADTMPGVVLVAGMNDAVLACALLAKKRGHTILRLDAGQQRDGRGAATLNSTLLDQLADELFTETVTDSHALIREGFTSERVHFIGSLVAKFIGIVLAQMASAEKVLTDFDLSPATLHGRYGLLAWNCQATDDPQRLVDHMLPVLRVLARDIPLVWPLRAADRNAVIVAGVDRQFAEAGVMLVRHRGYIESLGLLRYARCLVVGAEGELIEEAEALGKTTIAAGADVYDTDALVGRSDIVVGVDVELATRAARVVLSDDEADAPPSNPEIWDGSASMRLAKWLLNWLGSEPRSTTRGLESIE